MTTIGTVQTIARYPVKSMRGEELSTALLGLQGLPGDRAFAFVREGVHSPFPWLTGREYRGMFSCQPEWETSEERPRLFIVLASGERLPVDSEELRERLEADSGIPLRLHTDHRGNHDVAYVSVIYGSTIRALAEAGGVPPDHRRFRMNLVLENGLPAFSEGELAGKTLAIGDARIAITEPDNRCVMITFDPETGVAAPEVLKAAGQFSGACAGVYGSTLRAGTVSVGDSVRVLDAPG